jgi:hypothetical protein
MSNTRTVEHYWQAIHPFDLIQLTRDPIYLQKCKAYHPEYFNQPASPHIGLGRVRTKEILTNQHSMYMYAVNNVLGRSRRRAFLEMMKARSWYINWRLILKHPDYSYGEPSHDLRKAIAQAARGDYGTIFTDGSSISFPVRTYGSRYDHEFRSQPYWDTSGRRWRSDGSSERRITWKGAEAREMFRAAGLPCRCESCGNIAASCGCEWNTEEGTWEKPRPMVISGRSFLEYKSEHIAMLGKEGLAVGVELELRTVGRRKISELDRFCESHRITRKPDGSNGVSLELCSSPMREDVSGEILLGLHRRLVETETYSGTGCGLHVHVDATTLGSGGLLRLLNLWRDYGTAVWSAMPISRYDNQYCERTDRKDLPDTVELYGSTLEIDGWRDNRNRYVDLNLENLRTGRKTVEFRLFPSFSDDDGLEANDYEEDLELITSDQMLSCVDVSRAFMAAAQTNDMARLERAIAALENNF